MSLTEYARKRNFAKTAEPRPKPATRKGQFRFVIQKHAASHLHYDFRLELGGTLKSWAVPKGVPYKKGEKRLAMEVEDHPVSYIDFEGIIPQGQYGGGTVMVWDRGTYEPLSPSPSRELEGGKLHFILHGKKVQGEWYLVRLRQGNQWLLIKGKEDMKPVSKKMDDTSAISGKSMEELARGKRVWQSNRVQDNSRRATAAVKKPPPKRASRSAAEIDVEGTKLEVSNLDKVFYPRTGFTKGQVVDYYIRIARYLLPHLKNRPITLKRYPDGVDGMHFYEKECPAYRPKWLKTTDVPRSKGGDIHYCVVDTLPALVWAANLADLELHTFLHKAPAINRPTALAFDLDPGPPADIIDCCKVGLWLKKTFDSLGLKSFPKTSGSKGLQVYVPLNTPVTYEQTKPFAQAIAEALEQHQPRMVVSKMQKSLRTGKVLVDWSQNDDHKTTINVYSLRAKERPTVSAPVTWDEVASAKKARELTFESHEVLQRVEKHGDLFAPVLSLKQKLPPNLIASL
jgi:bifunctional non-homologous end joining protein LigD